MNGNTLNSNTHNKNTRQWAIRLLTLGLASVLMLGTTGCSVIMGIFGPEETVTTDSESTAATARTLQPTPAPAKVELEPTATSEENTDDSTEPTPTVEAEAAAAPAVPAVTQVTRRMVTITGPTVNLRSQPSTDSEILVTVPSGTTFEMTDQNDSGDWYQVCCINNSTAWVYSELAKVDETVVTVPQTDSPFAAAPDAAAPAASENSAAAEPAVTIDIPLAAPVFTTSAASDGTRYEYTEQGFSITLPNGWQPVDLSADRLDSSLSKLASENAEAAKLVEAQLNTVVNARYNFYATEATDSVLDTGYAATVSLLRQPLPSKISLEFYSQLIAKAIPERQGLITPVTLTPGSVPAGKSVTLNYTLSGPHGGLAVVEYLIMQGQTVYDLKFTTTAEQSDADVATFAAIAESFEVTSE